MTAVVTSPSSFAVPSAHIDYAKRAYLNALRAPIQDYRRATGQELLPDMEFSDGCIDMDSLVPSDAFRTVTVTLDNHFIHFMFCQDPDVPFTGQFANFYFKHWCEPCTDAGPRATDSGPHTDCMSASTSSSPKSPLAYEVFEMNRMTEQLEAFVSLSICVATKIFVQANKSRNMIEVPVPLKLES
ncbi:hypothetical protein FISHEDRAFT_75174 [Fistulina hepatica ATCC 64428]|uniref:Uncharacterized protein n=1 Tax=Fistulina hepatica ATCC 64428 TaxID=1128425 RepID=A0A0D7A949_9AGAR|nr:hypothetical protein FISHEDRAFT_75174 [Fistulina hepatica ATCC 64428]